MIGRTTSTAIFLLILVGSADAQAFRCTFPQSGATPFELVFAALDGKAGRAQLVGSMGTSEVLMRGGADALSFVEFPRSGAVMSTTIAIVGKPPFKAVHSRNTVIGGKFAPSQMIGECAYLD